MKRLDILLTLLLLGVCLIASLSGVAMHVYRYFAG